MFEILSTFLSLSDSDEAPWRNKVLSNKKRSRVAYKSHLSKLIKDIAFLNEFVPENLLHILMLPKSCNNNVAVQNEHTKRWDS